MSCHQLITGTTLSGKSYLARRLVHKLRSGSPGVPGRGVLLLDPIGDPSWEVDAQTGDPDKLLHWCEREALRCEVVIDEGSDYLRSSSSPLHRLLTRGRHRGHRVWIIAQDPTAIYPTSRRQCSTLWSGTLDPRTAELLAREWVVPELYQALPLLPLRSFVVTDRRGPLRAVAG